jgi:hypothetical protein
MLELAGGNWSRAPHLKLDAMPESVLFRWVALPGMSRDPARSVDFHRCRPAVLTENTEHDCDAAPNRPQQCQGERVHSNGPEFVSRVLDGGALGIIAPHIRSAREP